MCKLKETRMALQETIKDGAQVISVSVKYVKERVEVATYNSRFEDFKEWKKEGRPIDLVPPDQKGAFIKYCSSIFD